METLSGVRGSNCCSRTEGPDAVPPCSSMGPHSHRETPVSLRRLLNVAATIAGIVAVAAAAPLVRAGLHAQSDVIRGRITGPDNKPIENATITATSLQGNVSRGVRTNKDGRFQIVFPGDEGDYVVLVAAIGFLAKRFEVKRTADQDILVADAKLQT